MSTFKVNKKFAAQWGLQHPAIIQAPMAGGITTPELVSAVSNAGGLGSFATGYLTTEAASLGIKAIKVKTSRPFAVNLFVPSEIPVEPEKLQAFQKQLNVYREQLGLPQEDISAIPTLPKDNHAELIDLVIAEDVKIVSFTFGNLSTKNIQLLKSKGVYLIGTATAVEEAVILEQAGIDAVIAQGYEAGGHRGGFATPSSYALTGTMSFVAAVVDKVHCPVIAAGGIMDARGVVAALALGAAAVQMGTAFLTVEESGANPLYKRGLEAARKTSQDPTALTLSYSGKWARAIETQFMRDRKKDLFPAYPFPHYMTAPIRKEAVKQGKPEFTSMWCGQGINIDTASKTAAELLEKIYRETKEISAALAQESKS